jgi:hypothetical protein
MGVYYQVACDEDRERIDPGSINDLGIKVGAIAHPNHPFGSVVVFAMSHRWHGKPTRIVDDLGSDPGYFDYNEVTEEVVKEYNEYYKTSLKFTGG